MKEEALIESRSVRDDFCRDEYLDILDRVGQIATLPNTGYTTTENVAEFYKVPLITIKSIVRRHKDEFLSDGYNILSDKEFREMQSASLKTKSRFIAIFPRRSILRAGMLLRDSSVAKLVRSYLLNAEEITSLAIAKDQALQNMASQLSSQAREVAYHANQLTIHAEQLNKNAAQLILHADMIGAAIREISENKKEIRDLKNAFKSYGDRLSAIETLQSQRQITEEFISQEQIDILRAKVKQKGSPMSVWRKFNSHFGITRYKFLSASRFEEALAWIENYSENP